MFKVDAELARLYPTRFCLGPLGLMVKTDLGLLTWAEYLKGKKALLPREREALGA